MVSLIGYELKKMWINPFFLIGLILVIAVPLSQVISQVSSSESHIGVDGNEIAYWTWIREQTKLEQSYSGSVLDPIWNARIKEEYQINRKNDWLFQVDDVKMKEVYGDDWLEYWDTPKITQYYRLSPPLPNPYHVLATITSQAFSLIDTIENPNTAPFTDEQLVWIPYSELVYRRTVMEKIGNLIYGGHTNMDEFIRHAGISSFYLCLFYLVLFSGMFNKESSARMEAMIKTTKNGVKKIGYAKILTVILVSILVSTLVFGSYFLLFHGLGGAPHFEVSYMVAEFDNPFTYGQIYGMIFGLYLLCGLVIGSICSFLSSLFSSTYASFALVIVLFFLSFLAVSPGGTFLLAFHPLHFTGFSSDFFYNPLNIGSHSYDCVSTLFWGWLPIVLVCFLGSIWISRKRIAQ